MTLPELKKELDALKLPIAYRCFAPGQVPQLPYLVYYADEDIGFCADDIVYHERYAVTIEIYTEKKDIELEKKVKKMLTEKGLSYESYESFLDSEEMYLKAYEIEI